MNYCDKQTKQKTSLLGLCCCTTNSLILMNIINNRQKMKIVNLFLSCILYLVASQIHAQTVYYEAYQFQLIVKTSE